MAEVGTCPTEKESISYECHIYECVFVCMCVCVYSLVCDCCVLCIVALQLVVVCRREMEDRCHMINALDRYRVKVPPVDVSDVKSYLKQHFTVAVVPGHGSGVKPASSVDPERCVENLRYFHYLQHHIETYLQIWFLK